jgi:hypothetical protein
MLRAAATALAVLTIGACAAGAQGPVVQAPADGSRTPLIEEPPLVLPAAEAGGDAVMEAALESVLRNYCLEAVAYPAREAELAAGLGARAAPNPWFGRAFQDGVPLTAWSLPGASRSFFWIEADENGLTHTCWVKAFDGRRSAMAPIALSVIEAHAEATGMGPAIYDPRPLSALETEGTIDRNYADQRFSAGLSWDRSDYPALEGFVVTISAVPEAK